MQLTIQGKQIDLGDALRQHVSEKLEDINHKYFNHATFATVTFSKEGHGHGMIKTHILIRVGKDIMVIGETQAGDAYASFDEAAEKVAKQLRRYKKRLRDHHERLEQTPESEIMKARSYVIATEGEDPGKEPDEAEMAQSGDEPVIVAELATDIQKMSVYDAVMRMDLSGQTALLFRNAKHNGLNMVYRRPDGAVGWVDPDGNAETLAAERESA